MDHLQKEAIETFKETGVSQYIHQNELEKTSFQHGMTYGHFKDLTRRTASDKAFCNKVYSIAKNRKYDGYQSGTPSMVYNFLIKKLLAAYKNENMSHQQLAEELHKPIIKKFKKKKIQSPFIDNIQVADLVDMQLIIKFHKGFRFLWCVIDTYNKYAWVTPLKDKKRY